MSDTILWVTVEESVSDDELRNIRDTISESGLEGYKLVVSTNRLDTLEKEDLGEVIDQLQDVYDEA